MTDWTRRLHPRTTWASRTAPLLTSSIEPWTLSWKTTQPALQPGTMSGKDRRVSRGEVDAISADHVLTRHSHCFPSPLAVMTGTLLPSPAATSAIGWKVRPPKTMSP